MISRAVWVLLAAGCGGDAPSARSRVLDKIPAGVTSIAVADGRALSHARFRPLVDVLRSEVPAGFDCVVDAALAGEQIAAGVGPSGDVTVALASRAPVACAALGQVEDGLWIATLGAGAPAEGERAVSEQPRARPFLRDAPIALATTLGKVRLLATAAPEPLAAWAAFDARSLEDAKAVAATLEARLAGVSVPIVVERTGSQIVARLGATNADLAAVLRDVLSRPAVIARAFPCPSPIAPPVISCVAGEQERTKLEVYSVNATVDELLAARKEVVIANGRVEGVRLRDDLPTFGLASGDTLVAIDGKRVTEVIHVALYLKAPGTRIELLVSRLQRFGTIEIIEH
ncbi:MAG: hypothetical protein M4D80_07735 [Myxococcota bacterium]|nr:hypothetical protein [Myxococcota bacterium]